MVRVTLKCNGCEEDEEEEDEVARVARRAAGEPFVFHTFRTNVY